ncbi:hypothetical protein [Lutibaculum baratangense]|uniref:Peptide ABC transporter permease n=1 Tax=Lutibaculum baratangense AMV1 TaxID=631454 RepID=V4RCL6_9HYPH|nr:hypothetical protein [Lutibaculum baratangense]ESR23144.1 hypothetical protein N177_3212 [Lutibaculum baratangense AMV1]
MSERPNREDVEKTYSAESVRQGTIILRSRQRRAIFLAGLVGMVVLVLLFAVL